MEIKEIKEYNKHGCNWTGNSAIVDYQEEWENDKGYGVFNSGIDYEYSGQAMGMVKEKYPECNVLLAIPDVVVRIDWSFV